VNDQDRYDLDALFDAIADALTHKHDPDEIDRWLTCAAMILRHDDEGADR
jgi:hypothetical protein